MPSEVSHALTRDPRTVVAARIRPQGADNPLVRVFEPFGLPDAGLDPFPETRPLATDTAKARAAIIGVEVKPAGNRPLQPLVDKLLFWLRASTFECNRIDCWWANRMLATRRPLVEKMALFWHGHFTTHEDKVCDYRKMLGQVEPVVSTHRKLGIREVPGRPDFDKVSRAFGQQLLHPPTVAGRTYGKAWIAPGLPIERGNFVRDVMLPDFMAVSNDCYPLIGAGSEVRAVHERSSRGLDVTAATMPDSQVAIGEGAGMSEAACKLDREETFNTRYGSYRGWQKAVEPIRPIPRTLARVDLRAIVLAGGARITGHGSSCSRCACTACRSRIRIARCGPRS